MPIYEYRCQDCEQKFEALRSMSQADSEIACENCRGQHTVRMLSTFSTYGSDGAFKSAAANCGSCAGGSCASCGR